MGTLEKLGEVRKEHLKNNFNPQTEILENPNKDKIFEHLTALTNGIMRENSFLVKKVVSGGKNISPKEKEKILEELKKCREEGMSVMQKALEKLNLISES